MLSDYLSILDYQSIESLPWELRYPEDPETDECNHRDVLPAGIVLRNERGGETSYTLIGHDTCGYQTRGCSCCAADWKDVISNYNGWAWAFRR